MFVGLPGASCFRPPRRRPATSLATASINVSVALTMYVSPVFPFAPSIYSPRQRRPLFSGRGDGHLHHVQVLIDGVPLGSAVLVQPLLAERPLDGLLVGQERTVVAGRTRARDHRS